ncbi:hypothetical protein L249_5451, partial [Ophiocordyceps polyrhachis-furcata BCC 54312]
DSGAISKGGSRNVLAENRYLGMQIVALIYIEEGPALALNKTVREGVDVGAVLRCARPCLVLEATGSRRVCGSSPILVLAGYFAIPGL